MATDSIHRIDFSEEINAIRSKYSVNERPTTECYTHLARLWGFEKFNQFGVIESQTESIPLREPLSASIYFASSKTGYWLYGISAQTSISGISYAPNLFNSIGFTSQNDAREAAVPEITRFFTQESQSSSSTSLLLKEAVRILEDFAHPTLDLFPSETGGSRGR